MRISDWSSDVCSSDLIEAHGLKEGEFTLTTEGLRALIQFYTREAGVRTLEREIAKLARKALRKILEGKAESVTITPDNLGEFAGVRKYRYGLSEERSEEHTSELQSLMRISYAGLCLKKTTIHPEQRHPG